MQTNHIFCSYFLLTRDTGLAYPRFTNVCGSLSQIVEFPFNAKGYVPTSSFLLWEVALFFTQASNIGNLIMQGMRQDQTIHPQVLFPLTRNTDVWRPQLVPCPGPTGPREVYSYPGYPCPSLPQPQLSLSHWQVQDWPFLTKLNATAFIKPNNHNLQY